MRTQIYIHLFILLLICACSKHESSTTAIPEEKFCDFYAHFLVLQEEGKLLGLDSTVMHQRIDSLYQKYQITKAQVQSTLQYFKSDLQRWRQFYDKIIKRLEAFHHEESQTQKS